MLQARRKKSKKFLLLRCVKLAASLGLCLNLGATMLSHGLVALTICIAVKYSLQGLVLRRISISHKSSRPKPKGHCQQLRILILKIISEKALKLEFCLIQFYRQRYKRRWKVEQHRPIWPKHDWSMNLHRLWPKSQNCNCLLVHLETQNCQRTLLKHPCSRCYLVSVTNGK